MAASACPGDTQRLRWEPKTAIWTCIKASELKMWKTVFVAFDDDPEKHTPLRVKSWHEYVKYSNRLKSIYVFKIGAIRVKAVPKRGQTTTERRKPHGIRRTPLHGSGSHMFFEVYKLNPPRRMRYTGASERAYICSRSQHAAAIRGVHFQRSWDCFALIPS
jgi:hypothetical protein